MWGVNLLVENKTDPSLAKDPNHSRYGSGVHSVAKRMGLSKLSHVLYRLSNTDPAYFFESIKWPLWCVMGWICSMYWMSIGAWLLPFVHPLGTTIAIGLCVEWQRRKRNPHDRVFQDGWKEPEHNYRPT